MTVRLSRSRFRLPIILFSLTALSITDVAGKIPDTPVTSADHSYLGFVTSDSIFSFESQKGYFPSLMADFRDQFTAPFHFTTRQWITLGAAAGITGVLFYFDGNIDSWARTQKQHYTLIRKTSPLITELGNRYGFYFIGAVGAASAIFDRPKGFETSLLATQAMITTGAWTRLIKTFTGRERPKGAYLYSHDPSGEWYGPFSEVGWFFGKKPIYEYDSFPSGHTSQAFAIATVFASRYNDTEAVPILCYSTASLVGFTRLIEHEHWASDVFVGALLGYFCGKQVVGNFNTNHQNSFTRNGITHTRRTEFSLIQSGNQVGFSLQW